MRGFSLAIGLTLAISGASGSFAAAPEDYVDCQQTDDVDRSIAACSRVVADQAAPVADRVAMYVRRGYGYLSKNDLMAAIADFTEAIRLNPRNVYAYINRAIA